MKKLMSLIRHIFIENYEKKSIISAEDVNCVLLIFKMLQYQEVTEVG